MKVDSLFFSKGQGKGHSPLGGRQGNVTGQEQEASTADHQAAGGRRHVIIIKASVCGGERIRGEGHSPLTGLTDEGGGKGMWPVKMYKCQGINTEHCNGTMTCLLGEPHCAFNGAGPDYAHAAAAAAAAAATAAATVAAAAVAAAVRIPR